MQRTSLYAREQLSDLLTSDGGDDKSLFSATLDKVRCCNPKDDIKFSSVRIPPRDGWLNQDPWRHASAREASCEERILNLDHLIFQSGKSWSFTSPLHPCNSSNISSEDNHATPWTSLTTSEDASPTSYMHSLLDRTNTHTSRAANLKRYIGNVSMNESLLECSRSGSSNSPGQERLQQGYAENKQELQTMCMEINRNVDNLKQHYVTKDTLDSHHGMLRHKTLLADEIKLELSRLNVDFLTSQTAAEMWKKSGSELLKKHNDLQASSQAQISELKRQLALEEHKALETYAFSQRNNLQAYSNNRLHAHYNNGIYAHSGNGIYAHYDDGIHADSAKRIDAHSDDGICAHSDKRMYAQSDDGIYAHSNNGTPALASTAVSAAPALEHTLAPAVELILSATRDRLLDASACQQVE